MPVVAFVAWFLGAVSVAGFAGNRWWVLDLAASFRPQIAGVLLVTGAVLALARWWRTAAGVAAATVVNLAVILPLFFGPAPRPPAHDLRVLSFNLLSTNQSFDEVIEFISAAGADLVVLHEASLPWEEALAGAGLPYEVTPTRPPDGIFGSLVLAPAGSRVESYGFRSEDPRAVAVLLPDGVQVLAIHPLSPFSARRAQLRDQQIGFAEDWAVRRQGPVVVVGDFNATPWSYPFRRLVAATGLRDSERGFGVGWSFPARSHPLLRVPIDHLLHSADLAVADRRLGPAMGSDHFPLIVDLARTD